MNKMHRGILFLSRQANSFSPKTSFSCSSSDSDSDPEGGELLEQISRKDEKVPKKKTKKRRSQKAMEERIEKLNLKRQVNRARKIIRSLSQTYLLLTVINHTLTLR